MDISRFRGCLLGGALGDSLGAPVEFLSAAQIKARYGPEGPVTLEEAYGRRGAITDDTQMTMFTVEGLIRADARFTERGICHPPAVVHHAYLRWLYTQGETGDYPWARIRERPDGWLVDLSVLQSNRAPGLTCLGALKSGQAGSIEAPVNDSKGCGGVMRVAPVGLVAREPFRFGAELAALTHGHPSGYLSAGYLAELVHRVSKGEDLFEAALLTIDSLREYAGHEECLTAVSRAIHLSQTGEPTQEKVVSLGEGWVGEEALAIALYCALVASDFKHGTRLAVNHSGDSDSTGAICGNILGAYWGEEALPSDWLAELELRDELTALAGDLHAYSSGGVWQYVGGGRRDGVITLPYPQRSLEEATRYPAW